MIILCLNSGGRRSISPFRACTVGAFVIMSVMFIVVFATRSTNDDISAEISIQMNIKPVVKFEATRDSNETITYVAIHLSNT